MRSPMQALFVLLAAGGGGACDYSFDAETDKFSCGSNDDCLEGYVCGGHTMVEGDPFSFCVKTADAMVGFRLTTMYDATTSTDLSICNFDVAIGVPNAVLARQVWMVTSSSGADSAGYPDDPEALTIAPWSVSPLGAEACVGTMPPNGKLNLVCRLPVTDGGAAIKSAAIWVAMYDNAKPNPGKSDWWAVVVGKANVAAGELLASVYAPTFDSYRNDADACNQAVNQRVCPRASKPASICASCGLDTDCPSGFRCSALNCVHRQ
jgi:hypothetical protein